MAESYGSMPSDSDRSQKQARKGFWSRLWFITKILLFVFSPSGILIGICINSSGIKYYFGPMMLELYIDEHLKNFTEIKLEFQNYETSKRDAIQARARKNNGKEKGHYSGPPMRPTDMTVKIMSNIFGMGHGFWKTLAYAGVTDSAVPELKLELIVQIRGKDRVVFGNNEIHPGQWKLYGRKEKGLWEFISMEDVFPGLNRLYCQGCDS